MEIKTAVVFLTDGFEEIEAVTIIDILKRGGVNAVTVSLTEKLEVTGKSGIRIMADKLFDDDLDTNLLCLPGGPGYVNYNWHEGLLTLLRNQNGKNRYIAAICAAPAVLGELGLLEGKQAVCYPGMEESLIGAEISEVPVIVCGNIITSKSPGTAIPFALKLLEILAGTEKTEFVRSGLCMD